MNRTLSRTHGPTIAIGIVILTILVLLIGFLAGPALASPAQGTTPPVVVTTPAKVPGCTQKHFRYVVKKAYAKKKVSKRDHENIFKARICLKHQHKAKVYQRQQGELRKQRLDPWGHAWSKVDAGLKATLARVKHCESTGSYTIVNSSGHGGAYQYDASTWAEAGGSGRPESAPPREQDTRTAWFFPSHQSRWDASRHCWG